MRRSERAADITRVGAEKRGDARLEAGSASVVRSAGGSGQREDPCGCDRYGEERAAVRLGGAGSGSGGEGDGRPVRGESGHEAISVLSVCAV